jgi:hypothetical protein
MKTFIKKLYKHLCTWSIVYVIAIYTTFSGLNLYHGWFVDPYNIAMCVIGAIFLLMILTLEAFVRYWEIKDNKK